jgi:hypothetical protein
VILARPASHEARAGGRQENIVVMTFVVLPGEG